MPRGIAAGATPIGALVLAAGRASRFGALKQLAPFRGKPLLAATLDVVRASQVADVVLVLGHGAETIQRTVDLEGITVVHNPAYEQGLSTSIRTGLRTVADGIEGLLLILGDQPLVQPRTLNRLIEAFTETRPSVVIPTYRGQRGNPVLWDLRLRPRLEALQGDLGGRALFAELDDLVLLEVDDPGVVVDIDTRADLVEVAGRPRPLEAPHGG